MGRPHDRTRDAVPPRRRGRAAPAARPAPGLTGRRLSRGAGSISSRHGPRRDDRRSALTASATPWAWRRSASSRSASYWLYWYTAANNDIRMYLRNYSIRPGISLFALILNLIGTQFIALALLLSSPWLALGVVLGDPVVRVGVPHGPADRPDAGPGRRRGDLARHRPRPVPAVLPRGCRDLPPGRAQPRVGGGGIGPEPKRARTGGGRPCPGGVPSRGSGARTDARATGTNLVDPGDVGSRVTFQFELPNGYTTEAVGVFERWDEDAADLLRAQEGRHRGPGAGTRRAPRQGHPARAAAHRLSSTHPTVTQTTARIAKNMEAPMPNCPPRSSASGSARRTPTTAATWSPAPRS